MALVVQLGLVLVAVRAYKLGDHDVGLAQGVVISVDRAVIDVHDLEVQLLLRGEVEVDLEHRLPVRVHCILDHFSLA